MIAPRLLGGLLGLFVLAGCPSPTPSTTTSPGGTVTLKFAPPSRTVGVDWIGLIASYAVVLTSHDGFAAVSAVTSSTAVTVAGIAPGTWDIAVDAKDAGGTVVAHATVGSQTLPSATAISLTIKPVMAATGSYSLTLRFPDLNPPITSVVAQLKKPDGTLAAAPTVGAFTQPVAGTEQVVITGTGLPSGPYRLSLNLMRGGQVARYLNEAVNVFDNVNSQQWLAPDGTFAPQRSLTVDDFKSNNDHLDALTFDLDGQPVDFTFDPNSPTFAWTAVSVAPSQSYTLTPLQALPGQKLLFSTDGTLFTPLASGTTSPAQPLTVGTNALWVRVVAPDNTQRDYVGTITKVLAPYKLAVWNQGIWEDMGTDAPVGTVAIAGAPNRLWALTANGQLWEDTDGLWSRSQPDAPAGVQWIAAENGLVYGASPSALYSLSGGVWRLVAAGPGSTLKGLAVYSQQVLGLGTDGVLYRYDQKLWNPSMTVPGLVLVSGTTGGLVGTTATALQFFEPPLWLTVGDPPAHGKSLAQAFGSVVALIVQ